MMLKQYLGDLRDEFRGYNAAKFTKDLLAGLTVTAVALPLALAFGVSAGADAASGLITAVIAGAIMAALAGGYFQISGPTGAMAAILMSLVATYGMPGVFMATLIAGVLCIVCGLLHLGQLTAIIPSPVITGFTSGIAILIALGQVDNFFGVTSEGESTLAKLMSYGELGFHPSLPTVIMGVAVMVFMAVFPKKWNAVVPASLISIILATIAAVALDLDVARVGAIPSTLLPEVRLTFSNIDFSVIPELLPSAVSIALLCMIESVLCGASASRMAGGARFRADRELVAQGVGNLVLPFFGGLPASAAIARTSVAVKSGAQTRLVGIIHALGLLISMLALGGIMSQIPLAALAGVLMITAWRMNEWDSIKYIFSHKFKSAITQFVATMLATVAFDLTIAIVLGVFIGLALFVANCAKMEISINRVDPNRMDMGETHENVSKWSVVYLSGPMFFMTTEALSARLSEVEDQEKIIFSMRGVPSIDITAVNMLMEYYEKSRQAGREVLFAGVNAPVMKMFKRAGMLELAGGESFYFAVNNILNERLHVKSSETV